MIRKSYFDECRGERYERTLLALSDLVLKRVMEKTGLFTEELMSINERDGETKHQTAGRLEQMLSRSMEELRVFHEQRRAEEERWNRHAARVQQRYNGLLERKVPKIHRGFTIGLTSRHNHRHSWNYKRLI
jgi:hypothetical protein